MMRKKSELYVEYSQATSGVDTQIFITEITDNINELLAEIEKRHWHCALINGRTGEALENLKQKHTVLQEEYRVY
jgi:hypothetical protein